MFELMEKLKKDLVSAMQDEILCKKDKTTVGLEDAIFKKNVIRAIISMCPEIGKKPSNATDEDILKLLKRYINQQRERQLYVQKHLTEADVVSPGGREVGSEHLKKLVSNKLIELGDSLTSPEIEIAKTYLPKQATEEEIVAWIKENIDLSQFKNKMQAMGPTMKHFQGADGNFVKGILLKM